MAPAVLLDYKILWDLRKIILMFDDYETYMYRQISNMRRSIVGNKIVDHSDVVGVSPVGAAPTTSSFST